MTTINRQFRDYATRVAFSLHLSRNQLYTLNQILIEQEMDENSFIGKSRARREELLGPQIPDRYIPGIRALQTFGLIERHPKAAECDRASEEAHAKGKTYFWTWNGPSMRLTEAGGHVVALLQIAGLIHQPAANSVEKTRRKKVAA